MPAVRFRRRAVLATLSCGLLAAPALPALPALHRVTSPTTHVVRLAANRFVPAEVVVSAGDTVRFVNGEGGPHNVQFLAESIAVAQRGALDDAMRDRILPLTSPMFIVPDETYTLVVPALAAGRYPFLCSPHYASMRGGLIVR